jgi:hypothetical protein
MKNVNQRRKYVKINLHNDKGQRHVMGTALHETTEKLYPEAGAIIRCGGELDFIKMDRKELAYKQIDRNRRKLDKWCKMLKITDEHIEKLGGGI